MAHCHGHLNGKAVGPAAGPQLMDRFLYYRADFQPHLEAAFRMEITEQRRNDPLAPILVIVPTALLRRHLQRWLADALGAHANIRFHTLTELANNLGTRAAAARGLRPLPDFGTELLLGRALAAVDADAAAAGREFYFGAIRPLPGFERAFQATLADLKQGGVGIDDLGYVITSTTTGADVDTTRKLADIAAVFAAYEELRETGGWADADDLVRLAADAAAADNDLCGRPVHLYGFYDMNQLQRDLVAALFANSSSAIAYVPDDGVRFEEDEIIAETWTGSLSDRWCRWLEGLGLEAAPAPETEDLRSPELCAVLQRLDTEPAPVAAPESPVSILSCPGESREAREALRTAADALEDGIAPHRIAVLPRTGETYPALVAEIGSRSAQSSADADVAPRLQICDLVGRRLADTPEGRTASLLLRAAATNYRRREIMDLCLAAPFGWRGSRAVVPEPALWDVATMMAGIYEGEDAWQTGLDRLAHGLQRQLALSEAAPAAEPDDFRTPLPVNADTLAQVQLLQEFIAVLFPRLKRLRGATGWAEAIATVQEILSGILTSSAVRSQLQNAIGQLAALDEVASPDTASPLDQLTRYINEVLRSVAVERGSFQNGGVVVADIMSARGVPFDVVIVPGLVAKGFPAVAREDFILLDAERNALNMQLEQFGGGGQLPLKGERLLEERLLFRMTMRAAQRRVVTSFPRLDATAGRPRLASRFLLQLLEAVTGAPADYSALETSPYVTRIATSRYAPDRPERALDTLEFDLDAIGDPALGPQRSYLAIVSPFFRHGIRAEQLRWETDDITEQDALAPPVPGGITGAPVAPTQLERYAVCPYRYFLGDILGIEPLEEPQKDAEVVPLDRGALIHEIMERFLRELDHWPPQEADEQRLLATAADVLNAFAREKPTGYPVLWDRTQRTIRRWVQTYFHAALIAEAGEWRPVHFEVSYGWPPTPGADSLCAAIPVPWRIGADTEVRFIGKIDRIDQCVDNPSMLRIIDYKSGKTSEKSTALLRGGGALQLPVYTIALEAMTGRSSTVDTAAYHFIDQKNWRLQTVRFDRTDWEERRQRFDAILSTMDREIRSGRFPATAADQTCKYCPYVLVCGPAREALWLRKQSAAALGGFLQMRGIEND